jgi:hypothetical protein
MISFLISENFKKFIDFFKFIYRFSSYFRNFIEYLICEFLQKCKCSIRFYAHKNIKCHMGDS